MEETESEPRVVNKSATLYPDDWALARQVAQEMGSRSFSIGLRAIIQFYRQHKEQPESIPSQGG